MQVEQFQMNDPLSAAFQAASSYMGGVKQNQADADAKAYRDKQAALAQANEDRRAKLAQAGFDETKSQDTFNNGLATKADNRADLSAQDTHQASVLALQINKATEDYNKQLRPLQLQQQRGANTVQQQQILTNDLNNKILKITAKAAPQVQALAIQLSKAQIGQTQAATAHENAATAHENAETGHIGWEESHPGAGKGPNYATPKFNDEHNAKRIEADKERMAADVQAGSHQDKITGARVWDDGNRKADYDKAYNQEDALTSEVGSDEPTSSAPSVMRSKSKSGKPIISEDGGNTWHYE